MTMDYDTWFALHKDEGEQAEDEDEGYFDEDAAYEAYREGF